MNELTDSQLVEILAQREGLTDVRKASEPSQLLTAIPAKPNHPQHRVLVPDYLRDLDAIQPILAGLTEEEWDKFEDEFDKLLMEHCKTNSGPSSRVVFALKMKADQLARCICKAIWKGD